MSRYRSASGSVTAGLSVALGTLRTAVDARLETRGKLAALFAAHVGRDLMRLMHDVNALRDHVAVSPLLLFLFHTTFIC